MTNLLIINSSITGAAGNSAALTQYFAEALDAKSPVAVTSRELNETFGHLSAAEMQAWQTSPAERSPEQAQLAEISDSVVAEVQRADVIAIGMPLYNFGVPSAFKAWIDRLARAGVTFKYTENGPVGLLADKKVVILATRGGKYAGTPKDTQTTYLRDFFAFLGLTDVSFIYAEGLAMGDEPREASMAAARAAIDTAVDDYVRLGARSAA